MKRFGMLVLVLVVATSLAAYGADRIKTYSGTIPITLTLHDSTGFKTSGFTPIQISEMPNGDPTFNDQVWDAMFGYFSLSNLTELSTDSCVEGYNDTLILRYICGSQGYSYTVETDTGTLPASEFFCWVRDPWLTPTATSWIGGDSTAAYVYTTINPEGDWQAFMQDLFWVQYYVEDTSGTSGRLSGTINYYLKFVDFGD